MAAGKAEFVDELLAAKTASGKYDQVHQQYHPDFVHDVACTLIASSVQDLY